MSCPASTAVMRAAAVPLVPASRCPSAAAARSCTLRLQRPLTGGGLKRAAACGSRPLASGERARGGLSLARAKGAQGREKQPLDDVDEGLIGAIGTWATWACLLAYTFYFAPNQTPLRDSYFLEKLLLQGSDDGVQLNVIFTSVVALTGGVFPAIYTSLLTPSAKNGNWVPAWPFLLASVFTGSIGLLPYFALWEPAKDKPKVPPPADQLNAVTRVTESPFFAAVLLLASSGLLYRIGSAGPGLWYQFGRLWEESRLVHVATLDFLVLTFATPFWMYNDATARGFKQQGLLPLLIALPGVGPAIYLLLRPRSSASE
eukprot:jgi/Tetstr1/455221/TSEL_042069.t1